MGFALLSAHGILLRAEHAKHRHVHQNARTNPRSRAENLAGWMLAMRYVKDVKSDAMVDEAAAQVRKKRGLGSFRDLHESFLNELGRSRHGIRVDLDSGKQVYVSPFVGLRGRTTQLDLHTTLHQVGDKPLVRVAGRHIPVGVVRVVVQRHMARICVEDGNNLSRGLPVGDVILDELKVKKRSRQIPFERQGTDAEYRFHVRQLYWNIDMKWLLRRHVAYLSSLPE